MKKIQKITNPVLHVFKKFLLFVKKAIVNFFNYLKEFFFFVLPLSFSLFIYTNAAETIFRTDYIQLANAISYYATLPQSFSNYQLISEPALTGNSVDTYGKPISILIPTVNRKLELIPAIIDENKLYSKPNSTHFLAYESGETTSMFAYMISSWRTIPEISEIGVGSNLYIDTNRDWRYVYNIEELLEVEMSKYIPPKSDRGQIFLFIKDIQTEKTFVVRSEYRTILPIGR